MSVQLIQQYHANVDRKIRYGGNKKESALRNEFWPALPSSSLKQ